MQKTCLFLQQMIVHTLCLFAVWPYHFCSIIQLSLGGSELLSNSYIMFSESPFLFLPDKISQLLWVSQKPTSPKHILNFSYWISIFFSMRWHKCYLFSISSAWKIVLFICLQLSECLFPGLHLGFHLTNTCALLTAL